MNNQRISPKVVVGAALALVGVGLGVEQILPRLSSGHRIGRESGIDTTGMKASERDTLMQATSLIADALHEYPNLRGLEGELRSARFEGRGGSFSPTNVSDSRSSTRVIRIPRDLVPQADSLTTDLLASIVYELVADPERSNNKLEPGKQWQDAAHLMHKIGVRYSGGEDLEVPRLLESAEGRCWEHYCIDQLKSKLAPFTKMQVAKGPGDTAVQGYVGLSAVDFGEPFRIAAEKVQLENASPESVERLSEVVSDLDRDPKLQSILLPFRSNIAALHEARRKAR